MSDQARPAGPTPAARRCHRRHHRASRLDGAPARARARRRLPLRPQRAGSPRAPTVRTLTDALRAVRGDVLVWHRRGGRRRHPPAPRQRLAAPRRPRPGGYRRPRGHQGPTAAAIGRELAEAGVDWNLAPVADVPVARARSSGLGFGPDPVDVARHVAAYVEGLADSGVVGCAKHFPGHGATDADSHTGLPTVPLEPTGPPGRRRLERVDLVPFRAAVDAGVETVMLGHLVVEAVDPELPASLSAATVRLLARRPRVQRPRRHRRPRHGRRRTHVDDARGGGARPRRGRGRRDPFRRAARRGDRRGVPPRDRRRGSRREPARTAARGRRRPGAAPSRPGRDARCGAPRLGHGRRAAGACASGAGRLPPGPLDVVVRSGAVNIARGAWCPGTRGRCWPRRGRARPCTAASPASTRAVPLVVVVRDLHRHADLAREVTARWSRAARTPIVVEMGVPVLDPGGRAWVCSPGASAASVGRGRPRPARRPPGEDA